MSAATPEPHADIAAEIRPHVLLAREKALRRQFSWGNVFETRAGDIRLRLAVRVMRRFDRPLQILVTSRGQIPERVLKQIADAAGLRYYATDELPGNQIIITEALRHARTHHGSQRAQANA